MPPSPESNPDHEPIRWAKAHYDSIHGRIATAWKRAGDRFELEVSIPANTTATVYLPAKDRESVQENGQSLSKSKLVKFDRVEGDRVILTVESGIYHFASEL